MFIYILYCSITQIVIWNGTNSQHNNNYIGCSILYVYKTVLCYQPTPSPTIYPMQQQNTEVKIEQQHLCSTCSRSFSFIEELKIHQHSKHALIAHKKSASNDSQSDGSDTAQIPELINKRKLTRQKRKEQSIRQNDKISRTQPKLVQQKVDRQSQQHSEKQQLQTQQSSVVIPQPPPVTPSDDLYQKIYLCGCNNKFFEHKQDLSLHIKKQHLGFPPDGTLIGVSKELVLRQFKPMEQAPRYVYRYKNKKQNGKQQQNTLSTPSKSPLEYSEEYQSPQSPSNNNSTIKDTAINNSTAVDDPRKICSFCAVECTGKIKVCRDCSNWKYCGRCPLGALSWYQHIHSEHRIYTM